MTDHVHWNLEQAEAQMRADLVAITEAGEKMIADGKMEREFFMAQREFDEARLQYAIACMRAENKGIGRNETLSGAGYTLGTIWASMLQSCVGARERAVLNGWIQQALITAIGPGPAKKTIETVLRPMEAGHA